MVIPEYNLGHTQYYKGFRLYVLVPGVRVLYIDRIGEFKSDVFEESIFCHHYQYPVYHFPLYGQCSHIIFSHHYTHQTNQRSLLSRNNPINNEYPSWTEMLVIILPSPLWSAIFRKTNLLKITSNWIKSFCCHWF